MVKNIVFDLGRVLLKYEPEEYLLSRYSKNITDILYENIFASPVWLDLDRGMLSNDEAIEIIADRIPDYKSEVGFLLNNWTEILTPIEEMVKILHDLKSMGFNLFLITNFHKEAFYKVFIKYEFFIQFDKYILSSEVKLLKPEVEIFELLCDYCSIIPAESLFIDDSAANIDVAKQMGFKTVQHINPQDSILRVFNLIREVKIIN